VVESPITLSTTVDANLTAKYVTKLRGQLAASSLPIITQFKTTVESLSEAIPEEGTRFRAALKVLGNQGVTADQLAAAFVSLRDVLTAEKQKFAASAEQGKAKEVDAREAQVTSINSNIESLNKQIETLMSQRDKLQNEIIAAKTTLAGAQASFEGATSTLDAEINDILQKMRIYFPVAATAKK